MASQLVLIRHGETEWSKSGRHTSHTELGLTDNGRDAALAIAKSLSMFTFSDIFVSPRKRAKETAALIFSHAEIGETPLLAEWEYGDYEGLTTKQIHEENPIWNLWVDGCPNGESPIEIARRADAFLQSVSEIEGTVAVVSHGHFLRVLAARYIDLPVIGGKRFFLDTATLSVLGKEHDGNVIVRWNQPSS